MNNFILFMAFGILSLLIISRLILIFSRLLLKRARRRKAESLEILNAARQNLSESKQNFFCEQINYEITKGRIENKSARKDLN